MWILLLDIIYTDMIYYRIPYTYLIVAFTYTYIHIYRYQPYHLLSQSDSLLYLISVGIIVFTSFILLPFPLVIIYVLHAKEYRSLFLASGVANPFPCGCVAVSSRD